MLIPEWIMIKIWNQVSETSVWYQCDSNPRTNRGYLWNYMRLHNIVRIEFSVFMSFWYSGADNCISRKNRSNYDTSNRFGIDTLQGSPFMKKTRATQNFNMAAIFQDGRHMLSWNTVFCLKMAADGRKGLFLLHILYSKRSKCSIDVINTIKSSDSFNMTLGGAIPCRVLTKEDPRTHDPSQRNTIF